MRQNSWIFSFDDIKIQLKVVHFLLETFSWMFIVLYVQATVAAQMDPCPWSKLDVDDIWRLVEVTVYDTINHSRRV
jgi:hypothetical protein